MLSKTGVHHYTGSTLLHALSNAPTCMSASSRTLYFSGVYALGVSLLQHGRPCSAARQAWRQGARGGVHQGGESSGDNVTLLSGRSSVTAAGKASRAGAGFHLWAHGHQGLTLAVLKHVQPIAAHTLPLNLGSQAQCPGTQGVFLRGQLLACVFLSPALQHYFACRLLLHHASWHVNDGCGSGHLRC